MREARAAAAGGAPARRPLPARARLAAALGLVLALAAAFGAAGPALALEGGAPAAVTAPALPDEPYRAALGALGLGVEDLRIDTDLVAGFGQDRFRLPLFGYLARDARRVPGTAEALREHALVAARSPSEAVLLGGTEIQARVRRALIEDPLADLAVRAAAPDALVEGVLALRRAGGEGEPAPEELFSLRQRAAAVPPAVAEPAALVLLAEVRFLGWRERAFGKLSAREQEGLLMLAGYLVAQEDSPEAGSVWSVLEAAAAKVDFKALAAGAFDVALAAERASASLEAAARAATATASAFSFEAETPFGKVEIDGTKTNASRASDSPPLVLLVDLAGDDRTVAGGASRGVRAPVSVLIDVSGNDTYDTGDPGLGHTFGAGILGLGLLVDRSGDDRYRAGSFALGAGFFGIGVLADLAGADVYDGDAHVEGAALFGVGVLADAAGNDRYHAFDRAQGYGGVLGAGLLTDLAGDDLYVAEDTEIRRPSPQTREHNSSLAQGAASGHRADYEDGHSLAGGFGMLADGAGNDTYRAGVFAQGCGYWYGVGILADRAGDDTYEGVWYVQGAAAHFAAGVLHDEAGNDRYRATMNASQGCGHDFALGYLYERSGDDRYEAPNLSLGAGNACGIGILVDRGGDDRYVPIAATALVLGRAATSPNKPYDLRRWNRTLGVFLDLGGGKDVYGPPFAGNDRLWPQVATDVPDDLDARGALGVGMDR